jgi:hypothetical protein
MKVTLRKANAIQVAIQDQIKEIKIESTIDLNEFQSVSEILGKAREEALLKVKRTKDLLKAQYALREEIGRVNAISGVNEKLSELAFMDKKIAQLKVWSESPKSEEVEVIKGKLEKIRHRKEAAYYHEDSVKTGVFTDKDIEEFKKEILDIKKMKNKINDEVLELNVRTEVTLKDSIVDILRTENLI